MSVTNSGSWELVTGSCPSEIRSGKLNAKGRDPVNLTRQAETASISRGGVSGCWVLDAGYWLLVAGWSGAEIPPPAGFLVSGPMPFWWHPVAERLQFAFLVCHDSGTLFYRLLSKKRPTSTKSGIGPFKSAPLNLLPSWRFKGICWRLVDKSSTDRIRRTIQYSDSKKRYIEPAKLMIIHLASPRNEWNVRNRSS